MRLCILMLEATAAEMTSDEDVWARCSEDTLQKHGYKFSEQCGLVAMFLSRRLKSAESSEEVGLRLKKLCTFIPLDFKLASKTEKALQKCLVHVCSPSDCSVQELESAMEIMTKDDDNEILQCFITLSSGRVLKKTAEQVLSKRKESVSLVEKFVSMDANAARIFQLSDLNQVLHSFASWTTAASCEGAFCKLHETMQFSNINAFKAISIRRGALRIWFAMKPNGIVRCFATMIVCVCRHRTNSGQS